MQHGHTAAPVRARMLGPAPPPEDHRRDALRPSWIPACASGWARRRSRRRRRWATRTPGRSSLSSTRSSARVLLPGDEHPPAGRAPGHRAGDRAGPGAVADPHRRRRSAAFRAGGSAASAGTPSSAGCTPKTRPTTSCLPPARCCALSSRRGRACAWIRASPAGMRSPSTTTR